MLRKATLLVVFALMLIGATGCTLLPSTQRSRTPDQAAQGGPTPTPIPTPIVPTKPVYTVDQGEVVKIVQFSGRVAPTVEEELFFRVSGRARNIYVERGDLVTEGQVLADLEIDDLERELISTQLELERAEQQFAEAEREQIDALTRAQFRLDKAEADLVKAIDDQVYDMATARIEVEKKQMEYTKARNEDLTPRQILASADLKEAEIELRQAQGEYDKIAFSDTVGSSSQAANLQRVTLDYERAKANYDLAMQAINNSGLELNIMGQELELARLNLDRLEAAGVDLELEQELTLAQRNIQELELGLDPVFANNVERAKLNVEKLEAFIKDASIVAPFDGEVVTLSLTAGRDITVYKPVIIVADQTDLEVSANPLDSQLRDLTEEMPLVISLANQPGQTYPGLIRRLPYPYGGGGRTDGVEEEDTSTRISLEVPPREIGLDDGDLVRIEAVIERKDNVLWLPPQAVRTFDGRRFVVVQDGEAQRRVDVKVGIESEDRVEIEEGLALGQTIIGP